MANLPRGLVGLLLAVILCAAMSSTASELTALGGCTVVDFYRRSFRPAAPDAHYLRVAKLATGAWGVLAVVFAAFASLVDNLIQAVNILGSLFYGTILGIFLAAFFAPRLRATPVFVAAILSEVLVIVLWLGDERRIPLVQRDRLRGGPALVVGAEPRVPARLTAVRMSAGRRAPTGRADLAPADPRIEKTAGRVVAPAHAHAPARGMGDARDRSMRYHRQPEDTARMLMTRAPTTAAADDHLLDAAARMAERNVRHLPIVDGDRHVVGILSDRDVRTAVGDSSRPLHPDDARVRDGRAARR